MILPLERLGSEGQAVIAAARLAARETGARVALVGGAVRDLILGVGVTDIDLVAEGPVDRFADRLATLLSTRMHAHERFMTFRLPLAKLEPLDVVTARTETYPTPGALPTVAPSTIVRDLARRDFTLNCLAWDLESEDLIDPLGGLDDLRRGVLRILHDRSFVDDPTRLFRLLRLSARFGFSIDAATLKRMDEAIAGCAVRTVSRERIRRELDIGLADGSAPAIFSAFAGAGLLDQVLPGAHASAQALAQARSAAVELGCNTGTVLLAALQPEDARMDDIARLWGESRAFEVLHIRSEASHLSRLAARTKSRLRKALAASRVSPQSLALIEPEEKKAELIEIRRKMELVHVTADVIRATGARGALIGRVIRLARAAVASGAVRGENVDRFARRRALKYLSARRRSR